MYIIHRTTTDAHIYTLTHRVQLRLGFLSLGGLCFATSRSALQMIPLVSFIVCNSMFSHVRSATFSSFRHFAFAVEITFQSTGDPAAFIVLLFPFPEETDPKDMLLS